MWVRFIASPSGAPFFLAYFEGDKVLLPVDVAKKVIDARLAVSINSEPETATSKKQKIAEKR